MRILFWFRKDRRLRPGAEKFISELRWRDFYAHVLHQHPQVESGAFRARYDAIRWRGNPEHFAAWQAGRTGYPLVDAGMRELAATGFMHNRVRMVVASFLTKDLLLDWRLGEGHFMGQLVDGDLASNNGGWQWALRPAPTRSHTSESSIRCFRANVSIRAGPTWADGCRSCRSCPDGGFTARGRRRRRSFVTRVSRSGRPIPIPSLTMWSNAAALWRCIGRP